MFPTLGWYNRHTSDSHFTSNHSVSRSPVRSTADYVADRIRWALRTSDMYRMLEAMDLHLVPDADGPWYTMSEAARVSGLSRVTIRRHLDRSAFPHAQRRGEGPKAEWLIPESDLTRAGIRVDVLPITDALDPETAVAQRLAAAEALAAERAREIQRLEDELRRIHDLLGKVMGGDR
jgi:hypothetical protein